MILNRLRRDAGERHGVWPACRLCPGFAIDMGSARTRAWMPGRGVVLDVPTVTFPGAGSNYPVQRGRIVDVEGSARMLDRLLGRRTSYFGRRPLVVVTTPVLCDEEHRRAALTALDVLQPRTVLTIDCLRAGAMGARADLSEPLLVADVGAHLIETALLVDGVVAGARKAATGTSDLGGGTTPEELVRSVLDMITDLLKADPTSSTVDALARGLLLVGGGALRPEITYGLSRALRTPVQPAPAPHVAAVRGAAAALMAVRRHPAVGEVPPVVPIGPDGP